jgi:hypothetical protein
MLESPLALLEREPDDLPLDERLAVARPEVERPVRLREEPVDEPVDEPAPEERPVEPDPEVRLDVPVAAMIKILQ